MTFGHSGWVDARRLTASLLFVLSCAFAMPVRADLPFCIDDEGEQGRVLQEMGCVPALAEDLQVMPHELIDEIRVFRKTRKLTLFSKGDAPLEFAQLAKLPLLSTLSIVFDAPVTLEGLDEVQSLRVIGLDVNETDMQPLANLEGLRDLYLQSVSDLELSVFSKHLQLKLISIIMAGEKPLTINMRDMPSLEKLGVWGNIVRFENAQNLSSLKEIEIIRTDSTSGRVNLAGLSDAPALKKVFIRSDHVTGLEELAQIDSLESLQLSRVGLIDLSPLIGHERLVGLSLYGSSNVDLTVLRGIPGLQDVIFPDGTRRKGRDAINAYLDHLSIR